MQDEGRHLDVIEKTPIRFLEYLLGALEVSANLYCDLHLYCEGCVVICSYLCDTQYQILYVLKGISPLGH